MHLRMNDKHEYILDIPSVSKIIADIFPSSYEEVPEDILAMAQKRGICIHLALEQRVAGFIDSTCSCEPQVKSHIASIEDMYISVLHLLLKVETEYTEKMLSNGLFTGTIDLIGKDKEGSFILDYKTTSQVHFEKWYMQLWLYSVLADREGILFDIQESSLLILNNTKGKTTLYNLKKEVPAKRRQELREMTIDYLAELHRKCNKITCNMSMGHIIKLAEVIYERERVSEDSNGLSKKK